MDKLSFRKIYHHNGNGYYLHLNGKRQDRYFIEICEYHMVDEEETEYTEYTEYYNVYDDKSPPGDYYSFSELRKAKDKLIEIFTRDKISKDNENI